MLLVEILNNLYSGLVGVDQEVLKERKMDEIVKINVSVWIWYHGPNDCI